MKKAVLISLFSAIVASFAVSATADRNYPDNLNFFANGLTDNQQDKNAQVKTLYTCPMHSEIVQDKPGKCPKCGMNLVVKEVKKDVYTCPMHPEIVQDKAGKCPKCGMNLVIKEPVKESYTCPMHPEILQEKAGKCPKCGMDLVKKTPVKK
jgi:hypothetical protein